MGCLFCDSIEKACDVAGFYLAERTGFEPVIPFGGIHAFQACLFNHSSISPKEVFQPPDKYISNFFGCKYNQIFLHFKEKREKIKKERIILQIACWEL